MGEQTKADVVSMRLGDGDTLTIEGLALDVIYTPGHTDDSYSFVMPDRVFTGDTLLIRGTGRSAGQSQGDAMDGLGVYLATDYVASEYVAGRKWEIEHERSVRLARAECRRRRAGAVVPDCRDVQ